MNLRQMQRLAYDLDGEFRGKPLPENDPNRSLASFGIVNRATARSAGIHTRRMRNRKMKVPK